MVNHRQSTKRIKRLLNSRMNDSDKFMHITKNEILYLKLSDEVLKCTLLLHYSKEFNSL